MKVSVIGAGFVGLTTALGLAEKGHDVVCVDVSEERVKQLNSGIVPFFEPDVEELLQRQLERGKFRATLETGLAISDTEMSIICVGTPSTDKGIDLGYVINAALDIGKYIQAGNFHVVVVKSTVVPGSVDSDIKSALEKSTGLVAGQDFGLAMNPEFLREGCAVNDFMDPDRIVIGADDEQSGKILERLYVDFDCPVIVTSTRNAEMIKYASNSVLATLISFANEIASICESVPGLSEEVVMNGLFEDRRFWCASDEGEYSRKRPELISYLRGGIGFGGSCFPKDVTALHRFANHAGHEAKMLQSVLEINYARSDAIIRRLENSMGESVSGKKIAVIGTAFKQDTDDLRESPAVRIIASLQTKGAEVMVHDPMVKEKSIQEAVGNVAFDVASSLEEALESAWGAIIATAWNDYKEADWPFLASKMKSAIIFDGRQVIPAEQQGKGFVLLKSGNADDFKAS